MIPSDDMGFRISPLYIFIIVNIAIASDCFVLKLYFFFFFFFFFFLSFTSTVPSGIFSLV